MTFLNEWCPYQTLTIWFMTMSKSLSRPLNFKKVITALTYRYVRSSCLNGPRLWEQTEHRGQGSLSWQRQFNQSLNRLDAWSKMGHLYVFYLLPPVALSLICSAVIPSSLQRWATSWAANMAAYGDDSSLSAFTFIPPVTRQMVSLTPQTQMKANPSPVICVQPLCQMVWFFFNSI